MLGPDLLNNPKEKNDGNLEKKKREHHSQISNCITTRAI